MDYVRLGRNRSQGFANLPRLHDLRVERAAHLGAGRGGKAAPFIQRALELGINFFDTANVYSLGHSEEILGRAVRDMGRREELVIATKVRSDMRKDPNGKCLSRKAIMTEIDNSLRRLAMDYVDLYQIHRWDYDTPIEEDDGGTARRGEGRQGALYRRLLHVHLAVREGERGRPRKTAGPNSSRCSRNTT